MITIQMLAAWFLFSFIIFIGLTFIPWIESAMDQKRSFNTALVLLCQGLGALVVYAIHN